MPESPASSAPTSHRVHDPLWFKKGVIYQAHVRSFYDSDGNGIGDFRGLTQKLDYLQDLGVTIIWLLPFYPSPLKDDGYDIADYYAINPIYGTIEDFKEFLHEAHRRSLRVVTELVINHTSDLHPWFQRSRRAAPGSEWRDFYVWSDTTDKYKDARIIFRDFELSNWSWDPVAKAYYWHRFYSHQPDLNFDNPKVHEEIIRVLDFWLGLGVDGLRLDAVPYLYEREGTNCENLPETHAYLKTLRRHVDEKYGDRMLLAEANQWPEDAVKYFGEGRGDECHMAFHFPLMPRLFMSVRMEDRTPIIDILEQTPSIPETCQWAIFLRNHDELTLEMVTEEERDYMYRMYAADTRARINLGIRRRLAPLMSNERRRIELLNALLLSMPGTPVIYYGDEIGMGDNIYLGDRNGVRTPMHWSSDKNAGFSRANPQSLYLPIILDPEYHYEAVNVETQQRNSNSLLWWTKRILGLRQRLPALAEGDIQFLHPDNRKVFAFIRAAGPQRILVVANLSRHAQVVELDLSAFLGLVPIEILGRTAFPPIGKDLYRLSINPHGFFWFSLEAAQVGGETPAYLPHELADLPVIAVDERWEQLFDEAHRSRLLRVLPAYVRRRRWFGGKAREIKGIEFLDTVTIPLGDDRRSFLALLTIEYAQGDPEVYVLPMTTCQGDDAETLVHDFPQAAIARVRSPDGAERLLLDAMGSTGFAETILSAMQQGRAFRGRFGELVAIGTPALPRLLEGAKELEPKMSSSEQSNTAITYGDRMILKLFRRPDLGLNPDVEIGRFLTDAGFPHIPALGGTLEYRTGDEVRSLAILSQFVANARDARDHALDALARYLERVLLYVAQDQVPGTSSPYLLAMASTAPDARAVETVGTYLESARLLGQRTAELHRVLGASEHRDFAPEPFSPHYQRSMFQTMRNQLTEVFDLLTKRVGTLPETVRVKAERVRQQRSAILARLRAVYEQGIEAQRIRCHGDYHLGQVLSTGKDFVILDFEGEPSRALGARRLKRSPLTDVAGMLRSYQYAAHSSLLDHRERGLITPENEAKVDAWMTYWYRWVGGAFLASYLQTMEGSGLLPRDPAALKILLEAFLLHKAVYEINYELNNRPAWLDVPFHGILQALGE